MAHYHHTNLTIPARIKKTDTLRIDLVGIGLKCSRANNKGQLLSAQSVLLGLTLDCLKS